MAIVNYLDNEVPVFGEWDAVVENGLSTIAQSADASFPERGNVGLRIDATSGGLAYARKDFSAQEEVYIECFIKLPSGIGDFDINPVRAYQVSGSYIQYVFYFSGALHRIYAYTSEDIAWTWDTFPFDPRDDKWHWWTFYTKTGNGNAIVQICIDGVEIAKWTNRTFTSNFDELKIGCVVNSTAPSAIFDIDEIKIATSYPEPYRPFQQGHQLSAIQPAITPCIIGSHLLRRK